MKFRNEIIPKTKAEYKIFKYKYKKQKHITKFQL